MLKQYQIGDVVKIKPIEEIQKLFEPGTTLIKTEQGKLNFVFVEMSKMCGKKVTIKRINAENRYDIKGTMWVWCAEMFEDSEIVTTYEGLML